MELHLHLTVAFRALDRKWGKPVDLDTPEDLSPCLPAVIDTPTTTFSSEEFLRSRRKQKPYLRREHRITKEHVEVNDSFSNISCARLPSVSDLEEITSSRGSYLSVRTEFSADLDRSMRKYEAGSTVTLDSGLGRSKERNVFRRIKDTAKSFISKSNRRFIKYV
uniref:Uncharacterized protein n=1 Tax=Heliothis virescens TaxID=7102 RepID=A0A2A4JVP7_HELVI